MVVRVHLYGTPRRFSQPGTPGLWVGELPDGVTIRDLMRVIGTNEREVAAAAINDRHADLNAVIPPGAEVTLVSAIGGGCT